MQIRIDWAQLTAREVHLGDLVTLQEVRLEAAGLQARTRDGSGLRVADLSARLVVDEAALNRALRAQPTGRVRDLEVALLSDRVRISGHYAIGGPMALPFSFTAVPEIEGGARIRLEPRQLVLAVVSMPGFSAQIVGEQVNATLAHAFDVTRLPIPCRLTGVTAETGRLVLTATAVLELRPDGSSIVPAEASPR